MPVKDQIVAVWGVENAVQLRESCGCYRQSDFLDKAVKRLSPQTVRNIEKNRLVRRDKALDYLANVAGLLDDEDVTDLIEKHLCCECSIVGEKGQTMKTMRELLKLNLNTIADETGISRDILKQADKGGTVRMLESQIKRLSKVMQDYLDNRYQDGSIKVLVNY